MIRATGIDVSLTQSNFFERTTEETVSELAVTFGGMTLAELTDLVRAQGAVTSVTFSSATTLQGFHRRLKKNLENPNNFFLVNYDRSALEQGSGGHISPAAAYHTASDRVLILDTAAYKWPSAWVPLPDLFRAMSAIDNDSGESRGFLEVESATSK